MPARPRSTTMADVAEAAGVSTSTVSHVLNSTRKVQRAHRAGSSRGDQGDRLHARSHRALARDRPDADDRAGDVRDLQPRTSRSSRMQSSRRPPTPGYSLLLADTHDDPERELRATRDLLSRRVDGVILGAVGGAGGRARPAPQAGYSGRADRQVRPCRARPDRDRERRFDRAPGRAPDGAGPCAHRHDRRVARARDERRADRRVPARPGVGLAAVRPRARRPAASRTPITRARPFIGCSSSTGLRPRWWSRTIG